MRSFYLLVVALAVCVGACGSKDGESGGGGGSESEPAASKKVDEAFGDKVGLPTEAAKAEFGKPEGEVVQALGWDSAAYQSSAAFEDVSYSLSFDREDPKGLKEVELSAETALEPILTAKWGEPIKNGDGEAFWFDPDAGLRAWLPKRGDGKRVTFDRYLPLEQVLGKDGKDLAFAKGKPLLGATLDELTKAWGEALCNVEEQAAKVKKAFKEQSDSASSLRMALNYASFWLCMPQRGMATSEMKDSIRFGLDGKVLSLSMQVPGAGTGKGRDALIALLDGKWGKGVETKDDDGKVNRWYFDADGGMQVLARFHEDDADLTFQRYMPAKSLFEGDKPGLSFETDKTIGGTFEEIKASDPEHFRPHGTLAVLYYPPVEFNSSLLDVDLNRWAKKEHTHAYRVVIHYDDHPPFGEEIFKMLEAKFGDAKKDPSSTDEDTFYDFEKNGRKVRARRVSNQWQITVSAK